MKIAIIISLLSLILVQGVLTKPALSACEIVQEKDLPVSKQYGSDLVWSKLIVNFQQRIDACFSTSKSDDPISIQIIDANNGDIIAEQKFSNHLEPEMCMQFVVSDEHKEFLVNFHIKDETTVFHYIKICQTYLQSIVPVALPSKANWPPLMDPTQSTTTTLMPPSNGPPENWPPISNPETIPTPSIPKWTVPNWASATIPPSQRAGPSLFH